MKEGLRICVVGAGSSYTPELIEGILNQDPAVLPVTWIGLQDIDSHRLEIMAGLAKRMIAKKKRSIEVSAGTDLSRLLEGVQFVITQIRVGGMKGRHIDESTPLKYGIIGQETTGPGGMFKALRTIPAMLEIARTVERVSPDAFILNYTNPSGIITEAVLKHTNAKIIGLCSGIPGLQTLLAQSLGETFPDLKSYSVGLNHLGFIYKITCKGADVTEQAIDALLLVAEKKSIMWMDSSWLRLAKTMGAIPIGGYSMYYYFRNRKVREARAQTMTRSQTITSIEDEVFREAADPSIGEKPAALAKRGGKGYSDITFSILRAILENTGDEFTVSTRNQGAVSGFPSDATMELTCRIDGRGASPLPVGDLPAPFWGLVQSVKNYEDLTVEAAVTKCRKTALQALLAHPLVGDMEIAEPLLDEMLALHQLHFS